LFIAKRKKNVHFKCLITTICEVQSNLWFSRWRSGPLSDREQCDLELQSDRIPIAVPLITQLSHSQVSCVIES